MIVPIIGLKGPGGIEIIVSRNGHLGYEEGFDAETD